MRCDATWPDWLGSASRSTPSSRLGWSASNGTNATGRHAMVRMLARVIGVGVETADMLVQEVLSRKSSETDGPWPVTPASPGRQTRAGRNDVSRVCPRPVNARVRRGLIQLAWRFLRFQKDSALAQWYRGRTEDVAGKRKKAMIVALARKLLIALWRLVTIGEIPVGVALRTAVA